MIKIKDNKNGITLISLMLTVTALLTLLGLIDLILPDDLFDKAKTANETTESAVSESQGEIDNIIGALPDITENEETQCPGTGLSHTVEEWETYTEDDCADCDICVHTATSFYEPPSDVELGCPNNCGGKNMKYGLLMCNKCSTLFYGYRCLSCTEIFPERRWRKDLSRLY